MENNTSFTQTKQYEVTDGNGLQCEGCGLRVYGKAFQIPGIAGLHCSLECVEAHQFGMEACRWCGAEMLAPYTSINSRLCSDDCVENYKAHVSPITGDKTAALGTGQRLSRWLRRAHDLRATASLTRRINQSRAAKAFQTARTRNFAQISPTI